MDFHTDAVGSVRMVTDANGQELERHDYAPFGEPVQVGTQTSRFAGSERDSESQLGYFGARHHGSLLGRFTAVDPVMSVDDALFDPQRWNRYVYVMSRPLALTDPDGRCPSCALLLQRYGPQAVQVASRYGAAVYNWATRFFNTPSGHETVQTVGELLTGAQSSTSLLPALTMTRRTAFLEAALAEGRGGTSSAGRALQSHAARVGSWLADLAPGGNAAANTAAARKALRDS